MNPTINVNWVPGITLEEMEKQCILAAFRFYRGNKTTTAQVLGIAIRTLDNKLEKYEADAKLQQERASDNETRRVEILNRMRGTPTSEPVTAPTTEFGDGPSEAPRGAGRAEDARKNGDEAEPRVRVQSPEEVPRKQPVPLSQRKEVQKVLPRQAAGSSQRSRR